MGEDPTCIAGGCTNKPQRTARGYCQRHYRQGRLDGSIVLVRQPQPETCSVEDCGRPAKARTLCKLHHERMSKGRDMSYTGKFGVLSSAPPSERFWARIDAEGDCWLWIDPTQKNGYGLFNSGNGKNALAHRWAWEELVGPIPEGFQLDHLCVVPLCVNPDHLEPVTPAENLRRRAGGTKRIRRAKCANGHGMTPDNIYVEPKTGCEKCRECARVRRLNHEERKKLLRVA